MSTRPHLAPIALLHAALLVPAATFAEVVGPSAALRAPVPPPTLAPGPTLPSPLASPGFGGGPPGVDGAGAPGAVPIEEPEGLGGADRWRRMGLALPILETAAISFGTMGWNRYVGGARWANVSAGSVERNLGSGWVLDDNAFFVNQIGHPYQGTWSFTAARSAGLGFWESAPFTFLASAFWEVAGETERPAVNDQVTTTVAGVVLGEVLHRFAGALRAEGGGWRDALASVLSPLDAVNAGALGRSGALPAPPSRWQLSLGSMAVQGTGDVRGGWEPLGYAGFSFVYGLPGDPALELERPFDHFVFDGGYGMDGDPVLTLRARGLLAGSTFDLDAARGLFGLFLSFDLDTPPRHQVSTSAIGFGGSARWEAGPDLSLEADAVASGVILGAGSRTDRGPDAGHRDYRFGPGEQAYVGLRLLAGSRATVGVALRQYFLAGAGPDAGSTELLLEGAATAVVRVAGPHGVGVELGRYGRTARADGGPAVRQDDSTVRIYYALLGGHGSRPAPRGAGLVASRER